MATNAKTIRILVVDDSLFMRTMLISAFRSAAEFDVIGTAENGPEALEAARRLQPDVITLDVEMPGMTGLEVLRTIMRETPIPIVMVSTKTQRGAKTSLDAYAAGAIECIAKPVGQTGSTLESFFEDVRRAVRSAVGSKPEKVGRLPLVPAMPTLSDHARQFVVAIGISAGGPATLHKLLPALPADSPPVVIVQHMPNSFTAALAKRLDDECKIEVKEAKEGDALQIGRALIAPGDWHMRVKSRGDRLVVGIDQGPKVSGFRPSVDVLFESLATIYPKGTVAMVLTGMGCDGAAGLTTLKRAGGQTLAQDAETSIVYGMPKAAADTGHVDEIAPLHEIPDALFRMLNRKSLVTTG